MKTLLYTYTQSQAKQIFHVAYRPFEFSITQTYKECLESICDALGVRLVSDVRLIHDIAARGERYLQVEDPEWQVSGSELDLSESGIRVLHILGYSVRIL